MVINEEEKNAFTQSVMGDTEGGGGGGSSDYDLVIKCLGSFNNFELSQLSIETGSLENLEVKIHDEQKPISGCLVQYRQDDDPSNGYVMCEKYDLAFVDVYYRSLIFISGRDKDTHGGGKMYLYYDEYYVINDYSWTS